MPDDNEYKIIICNQCGAQSEPDMRFCTNCGASLTQNPITPTTKPAQTSTTITTESQAGNLLFQRLSSKTPSKPKKTKSVTKLPVKPQRIEAKPIKSKPQKRVTRVEKKVVVDQKYKLKLLEHLKELNKLDRTLEASAIIRYRDHTVMAAATSSRTSESLMVTITSTIFDICQD